jgi:hypothetical protein
MFSPQELAKIVQQTVPADRTKAIVLDVDANGLAVVVQLVKDKNWEIQAVYTRDWAGDQNAGARVIYSW